MNPGLPGFGVIHHKTMPGIVANIILVFVHIVCEWIEPKNHFIRFRVWVDMAYVEPI